MLHHICEVKAACFSDGSRVKSFHILVSVIVAHMWKWCRYFMLGPGTNTAPKGKGKAHYYHMCAFMLPWSSSWVWSTTTSDLQWCGGYGSATMLEINYSINEILDIVVHHVAFTLPTKAFQLKSVHTQHQGYRIRSVRNLWGGASLACWPWWLSLKLTMSIIFSSQMFMADHMRGGCSMICLNTTTHWKGQCTMSLKHWHSFLAWRCSK